MNLKNIKILGGVGAFIVFFEVLLLHGIAGFNIPRVAGIIIILFSLYNLANFYQSRSIFNNARLGALIAILGLISGMVGGRIVLTLPVVMWLYANLCNWIIGGVLFTVAAFFVRRSLNELAVRSGVSLFKTVAIV